MFLGPLVEFLLKFLSSRRLTEVFPLIDDLFLNSKGYRLVVQDSPDDFMGGLERIVVTEESCPIIESRLEESADQLLFPGSANFFGDLPPHGRHDNDIAKCLFSTHRQKGFETLGGSACEPHV